MHKIAIVEDDESIRSMVLYALRSVGFEAEGFGEAGALWSYLQRELPTLLLLDIMLPGEDGIAILQKLKGAEPLKHIPVIMLTAKGGEFDRIRGLDLGADDYITKPFSVLELISRIKAVLRRCLEEGEKSRELTVGNISLHLEKREVRVDGQIVTLTYKEFELLHYLMLNEDIALTRDRLLDHVWGYSYAGESRTVDMHIKTLRQKLGAGGELIHTVRNVGYKLGG